MEKIEKPADHFEQRLSFLLSRAKQEPLSLETVLSMTSGKGKILLLVFLSLVFGQIPILSFFFGLFIMYIGIRVILNNTRIWLPHAVTRKKIPAKVIEIGLKQVLNFLKLCNHFSRPRYEWALKRPLITRLSGIVVALVGLSICCMPPVPLIGYLAIAALFCIGIGLLNDDGLLVILGYAISCAYFLVVLGILKYFSFSALFDAVKAIKI